MPGEFVVDFGTDPFAGGFEGLAQVAGTPVETPAAQQGGGFSFSDLASGVKSGAKAVKDVLYTPPTEKGGEAGGILGTAAEFAKPVLPFAQLATAGMGMAGTVQAGRQGAERNRMARLGQQMQQQSAAATQAAAAPLTTFGTKQLEAAEAGKIPPAIQAKIEEWKQGAMAQAKDYAARSGQGDSQMLTEWIAWIEQQGKAMEASYLQQEEQLGIQGLKAGAGAFSQAGTQEGQLATGAAKEGEAIATLMSQANQTLARLTAGAA